MKIKVQLFSLFTLAILVSACQPKAPREVSSLSAENPYVFAYTSGIISAADPIVVEFANDVIETDQIGQEVQADLLSFSPGIKGVLAWENTRTLRFTPEKLLPAAATYQAKLQVAKVLKAAKGENRTFDFEFQTKAQNLALEIDNLRPLSNTDLSKQEIKGTLFTSDVALPEAIETTLDARQGQRNLDISWNHQERTVHQFTVNGVNRGDNSSEVEIAWNGKALGVSQKGERKVSIPALGDFKVMEAEAFQEPEQYARIQFSDPLLKRQDLRGLISLEDYTGDLRFTVENNQVRVYPTQRLLGDYTLVVSPGIRNINDKRMPSGGDYSLRFEEVKPELRLVGNGVILPSTDGLVFPFEAIGLNAVDLEIFKIYSNNILQFLQSNTIQGDYEMNAVGRIIQQEKITLSELNPSGSNQRWMRYAIDLSSLIDNDPRAIYQIRLGFRPEYSTLACPDPSTLSRARPVIEEESEEPKSILDNYYGVYGYYDGYDWNNRDNPCYPEFYNRDRFVSRNVIASNLGIISKMGQDKRATTIITDLRTAAPVNGAQVTFYDYQQQPIGTATTDSKGFAKVELEGIPFVCIAEQGGEIGYLRMQDGDALSLSRFDVSGASVQKGLKGFLYGERGVWRPGDSIYLNFVLEDQANPLPEDYPISLEIYDARGQLFLQRTVVQNTGQVYPLYFSTPKEAPTGNWRATVKVGGANFSKTLKVETVKPNRLKIDVGFGQEELSGRTEVQGTLQANWLYGAPASDLKAKVEAQLSPMTTRFEDYPSFVFDDPARSFSDRATKTLFDGRLSASGAANFSARLLGTSEIPGKMRANIRTRVFEKGGDFSIDAFSIPYSPFSTYLGVEIPTNKYDEPRVEVGENGQIRFVAVDAEGNPQANRQINVGFYRVNWRWWWDQGYDNVSNYNSTTHNDAVSRIELTTNTNGVATWNIKPDRWGRYLIRVCDMDGGHCSGSYFYAGYPWYGNDDNNREVAAMLNFKSDKEQYSPGETVQLTIPGGKNGRALVSLETGTEVLDQFWVETQEGENQISFDARAEMAPTIYANVSMVQAHGQADNDLPIRMYGVLPIRVEDPDTRLEPSLAMPESLRPEQNFTVEISEENRKEMAYTLAIVDEGLLGLTRFSTPNPHDAFYAREALGVKTWDVFDNVLGAYGAELDRLLSIGGDDVGRNDDLNNSANRFEPVVRHLGPFKLGKGQKNKHEIRLPNYVGAVRVMVVASSAKAYGAIDKTVPVKNPLMVLATLPRVLSPGDELKVPVNVFVTEDKVKRVNVRIKEASGLANLQDNGNRTLSFQEPGDQLVEFPVKIVDGVGTARFEIEASGNGESASQVIEIQVRNPNPYQTKVLADLVNPGQTWSETFSPIGMQGTNEAILEVSSIPPIDLGRRLNYLLRYPYGCLEQTVSSGFPQLFVNKLIKLSEEQKASVPDNIVATINRIQQFQLSNGGLAYWPGENSPNQWGTNYATHFLLEAKSLGYSVPTGMLKSLLRFQKQTARLWSPRQEAYGFYARGNQQLTQAYRLYTLALAGDADLSAMNRLRESEQLEDIARWRLAAAYALAGRTNIAQDLVSAASTEVPEYQELSYTYGSHLRDQAMILETLTLLKEENKAAQVVQDLSDALSDQRWLNTQTTAYGLLAIGKFVGITSTREDFNFAYNFGRQSQDIRSEEPVFQIALDDLTAQGNELEFRNKSNARLFVRLILNGQPRPGLEKGSNNNLGLEVRYLNPDGSVLDPGRLTQGQDFTAEVTVRHPNTRPIDYEELALAQAFPAGWEISNARMDGLPNLGQSSYTYQDIRDDAVHTFFDLQRSKSHTYRVQLTAAYQGRFYLPAQSCEAMYDQRITAYTPGQWVEVVAPGNL
ncbi:MAG TPA: MG2 domain-containing protein [Saprospiraceae bacterium]|nr:MG2 domain-containing protein [Saprospiraceae bacterium]